VFDEIRQVKYLGHWPVSLMRTLEWTRNKPGWPSKPVVERALANRTADGQWRVFGWETTFYHLPRKNNVNLRVFNMDMASFAFRCGRFGVFRWPCGWPCASALVRFCCMGSLSGMALQEAPLSEHTSWGHGLMGSEVSLLPHLQTVQPQTVQDRSISCTVWGCAVCRSSLLWEDPDPKTGYPKKPLRLIPTRMG